MDSKKVLYFLGLLNRETSGHTDEIAEIYLLISLKRTVPYSVRVYRIGRRKLPPRTLSA